MDTIHVDIRLQDIAKPRVEVVEKLDGKHFAKLHLGAVTIDTRRGVEEALADLRELRDAIHGGVAGLLALGEETKG